jgi:hypothetical protein
MRAERRALASFNESGGSDRAAALLAFGAWIVSTIATTAATAFAAITSAAAATTTATAAATFAMFTVTAAAVAAIAAGLRTSHFVARIARLIGLAIAGAAIFALETAASASAAMTAALTVGAKIAVAFTTLIAVGTAALGRSFGGFAAEEIFQPTEKAAGFLRLFLTGGAVLTLVRLLPLLAGTWLEVAGLLVATRFARSERLLFTLLAGNEGFSVARFAWLEGLALALLERLRVAAFRTEGWAFVTTIVSGGRTTGFPTRRRALGLGGRKDFELGFFRRHALRRSGRVERKQLGRGRRRGGWRNRS